jgi:hypothetical protein
VPGGWLHGGLPKIYKQTDLLKLYKKKAPSSFKMIIHIEEEEEGPLSFSLAS